MDGSSSDFAWDKSVWDGISRALVFRDRTSLIPTRETAGNLKDRKPYLSRITSSLLARTGTGTGRGSIMMLQWLNRAAMHAYLA